MEKLNDKISEGVLGGLLTLSIYSQNNETLNNEIDKICQVRLKHNTSWLKKLRSILR
jgi:hypothetical protein